MTPADDKKPQAVTDKKAADLPDASEFGKWVSTLTRLGIRGQDLSALIRQEKSRAENADALRQWLKSRPKAK